MFTARENRPQYAPRRVFEPTSTVPASSVGMRFLMVGHVSNNRLSMTGRGFRHHQENLPARKKAAAE